MIDKTLEIIDMMDLKKDINQLKTFQDILIWIELETIFYEKNLYLKKQKKIKGIFS
jgi:hypothetical protein